MMAHFSSPMALPDDLRVGHDGVRPEEGQVIRLRLGVAPRSDRLVADGRAEARAALVEEQHPVVVQSAAYPATARLRPGRRAARSALEEDQVRKLVVPALLGDELAGEDGDALAGRVGVVERHLEPVVGHDHARQRVALPAGILMVGAGVGGGRGSHVGQMLTGALTPGPLGPRRDAPGRGREVAP